MHAELDTLCHYLKNNNILDYQVINHVPVKTMNDVFRIIQSPPSQMIKAVLLKVKKESISYVLLGIPADRSVSFSRISEIMNVTRNKIALVMSLKVKEITGYEPGALPPFSLDPARLPFIIDDSFANQEVVFCGAGTPFHTLKIKMAEIKKLPGFREDQLF